MATRTIRHLPSQSLLRHEISAADKDNRRLVRSARSDAVQPISFALAGYKGAGSCSSLARHGLNPVVVADPCRFAQGFAERLRNGPVHAA
jgi:hypothetical protein